MTPQLLLMPHKRKKMLLPLIFGILLLFRSPHASAQCTTSFINWDWQYKVAAYTSPTNFGIGVSSMSMSWGTGITSPAIPANNGFTGYGATGFGNGNLLQFVTGNGTVTFTFATSVTNLKFAVYDIDNGQALNVTAADSLGAAKTITMAGSNTGSSVTVTGNNTTSATGTGPAGDLATTATTSGVNVTIAGPVKTVTLNFTKSSGTDNIWISDISACVSGDYISSYTPVVAPEAGQPTYVVSCDGTNNLFAINTATGVSRKLFTDAGVTALNSLAYDPYKQYFYYCDNTSAATNKSVYRYDLKTCTKTTWIADVTVSPYNIPVNSSGVGSGGGSFNNGSLFLGIDVAANTNEDAAIWRIDIDSTTGNAVSASRVFGVLGSVTTPSAQTLYNWADFVVYNGVVYNFNAGANAAANTNLQLYSLDSQLSTLGYTNAAVRQASVDYAGNIYNINTTISKYSGAGVFGTPLTIAGDGWAGSATDAAEYFKFPADYGDAPATYGRPFHDFKPCSGTSTIRLGATVDYEINPVPAAGGATANGDDNANYTGSGSTNDEDAFSSFPTLTAGVNNTYTLSNIPVANTSAAAVNLYGWIDFNHDGNFSANEIATASVAANATTASLTWTLTGFTSGTDIVLGGTYARFRITSNTLADSAATTAVDERSTSGATDGEVEDYSFTIAGLNISGTVSNDVNGLTDATVNGTGIGTPSGTQLYAYLVSGGIVAAKATVAANGTYSFPSAAYGNKAYTVAISTTSVAVGVAVPATAALPTGWVSVGDAYGTNNAAGTGNESGTPDSRIALTTGTADVTGVNFGIEQLPTATTTTLASQVNPGGTNNVSIASTNFTGTDPDGGSVTQIRFTAFPTNVTSITIGGTTYTSGTFPGGGVTVATGTAVSIDPVNGAVTAVIPFAAIDNAGKESSTTANVNVPFTDLTISGTVFDDADAGTINGTATNTIGANTMYASLVDNTTGFVLASSAVAANGTYSFGTAAGVKTNTTFKVVVTNAIGTVGQVPPSTTLTNAVNTAEGTAAAGDGTPDGVTSIAVTTASVSGVNFGIDQLPVPTTTTLASQTNPGGTNTVSIASTNFTGTDADGSVSQIHYTAFPSNVTSITIGGTTYTSGTFPGGGVTVATGTAVSIDPVDGAVTAAIPFRVIDNGGKESTTTANVNVPFTDLTISGTVFDDADAGTINGTATNTIGANTMYASLVDNTTGFVLASSAVAANGTYSFGTAAGVKTNTTFKVVVTNAIGTVGQVPPSTTLTNAVNTAEGTAAAGDGTPDGVTSIAVTTASVSGVNFGIDQLPVPTTATLASQTNPGGTNNVSIASTNFTGTDADGSVSQIHYTAFPSNVTSITIGGTTYTSGTFPGGGVTVATGTAVSIDPVDGAVTAAIPFRVIDNGGKESTTTANVNVPFIDLTISGTVFDDADAGTINGTATNTIGANTMYASLVDNTTGFVLASSAVAANGTYSFGTANGVKTNTTFKVVVTNAIGTVGQVPPSTTLTNAVNTAEGTAAAGDGTPDGVTSIAVTTASVSGVNFGIDQLPVPTTATLASQTNPGGTNNVSIASTNFTGTDADGSVSQIHFTAFPSNVTSITIGGTTYTSGTFPGGGVTVATGTAVSIDPINGAVTAAIPFRVIDNGGKESTTTANVNVPFSDLTISGTVFDDADGGTINGTATNTIGANTMYASLVDNTTGFVLASSAVAANGTYSFGTAAGIKTNTTFKVVLTNAVGTVGQVPPSTALTGAANTAEGTAAAGDGTPDGVTSIPVTTASVSGVNFGVDLLPTSTSASYNISTPAYNSTMALTAANSAGSLAGTDPEDGALGSGRNIVINSLANMNGNTLFYNGSALSNGSTISAYNPSLLTIKFSGTASTTASFTFSMTDGAGKSSAVPATYSLSWTRPLPLELISFDAVKEQKSVHVIWKTANEINVHGFEVQHSTNGSTWETIGKVPATSAGTYNMIDNNPSSGANFYRLKTVDNDGAYSYSDVRIVRFDNNVTVAVHPNPVVDKLYLDITDIKTVSRMIILDINGRIVASINAPQSAEIDMSSITAGVYMLQVYQTDGQLNVFKIVRK